MKIDDYWNYNPDFYDVDNWIDKIPNIKGVKGIWEFWGIGPSGAWRWENDKMPFSVAATPFWSGDSLTIQIDSPKYEMDFEYDYITPCPRTAKEYIMEMRKVFRKLSPSYVDKIME